MPAITTTPPSAAQTRPPTFLDPWVWRMAWRDSRRSRGRLLVFSTALTLGVAALVAIGSLGWNLQRAIHEQARTLVGADIILEGTEPLDTETENIVTTLGGTARADEIRLASMSTFPKTGGSRLTQVRAIAGGYPFYGKIETDPPGAAQAFADGKGALAEGSLMLQYGEKPGDLISIGGKTLPILGTVTKLPGEASAFASIAPRVLIPRDALPASLLVRGSLVRYLTYLKLPPGADVQKLIAPHDKEFHARHLEIDTVAHRENQLGRVFTDVNHFLNLVSFIALLLGGIGVASAIHAHLKTKLRTVAVLRCLGASSQQTLAIYLIQALALGLVGALTGAVVGILLQALAPLFLNGIVPVEVRFGISWLAVVEGVGIGFLTCALFTLLPLLPVRRTPPLLAIRAAFEPSNDTDKSPDPWRWLAMGLLVAALLLFPWLQSRDPRLGFGFSGALFVSFGLLALTAYGLMTAARKWFPASWPFEWRQGLANLYRPNNRTLVLVFTLGLSTFLLLGMYLTKDILLRQFATKENAATQPNLVFFDIQTDQKDAVAAAVRAEGLPIMGMVPTITMRLASVGGRPSMNSPRKRTPREKKRSPPGGCGTSTVRRTGINSTTRRKSSPVHLRVTLRRVPGWTRPIPCPFPWRRTWPRNCTSRSATRSASTCRASRSRRRSAASARWTGAASSRISSWCFPTGVLEAAPTFNVMVTRAPNATASGKAQADIVKQFPTVSAIDLSLIVATIKGIVDKATTAVRLLSLFTVGTGLLVLAAAIITGRYERVKEGVLLRTLGASRKQIFRVLTVEYFCLGSLSALTGIILAAAGNWALAVFVFKLPWAPSPVAMVACWFIVAGLTVAIGLLASRGVCDHPPLEILRAEE